MTPSTKRNAIRTLVSISREHKVDLTADFDRGMAILTRLSREVAVEFGLTDSERAQIKDAAIGPLSPLE